MGRLEELEAENEALRQTIVRIEDLLRVAEEFVNYWRAVADRFLPPKISSAVGPLTIDDESIICGECGNRTWYLDRDCLQPACSSCGTLAAEKGVVETA